MSCGRNGRRRISSFDADCWKFSFRRLDSSSSATTKNTAWMTKGVVDLKANLETFLALAFVQQNLESRTRRTLKDRTAWSGMMICCARPRAFGSL